MYSQNSKREKELTNHIHFKVPNTVTKADVIAQISDKTGVDKADVQQTLETFFTVVKDSLADGENLYVRGFGSFINKKRARKVARNISKGESMIIDEHFVPSFKPAKVFVEQVKTSDSVKAAAEK
ncbi:HU family DNA-binding protein [Persicitalea sp.]|uniref:HU family DNA-binding protein n=1 Tax=Persicitalea sp. TaxID=3100273 RepID=UPI0035931FDC